MARRRTDDKGPAGANGRGLHIPARTTIDVGRISRGFWDSMVLLTAHRLGLFETIGMRSATARGLARRTGFDARALVILLDALTALGFLSKRTGAYRLTALARKHLVDGSPHYLGRMLDHHYNLTGAWIRLPDVVRRGGPALRRTRRRRGRELRDFILAMDNIASQSAAELVREVDLSGRRMMLDLGGGPGTYAVTACRAVTGLRAVVFDLPETIVITREVIAGAGMEKRIETLGGDYETDSIGTGYDLVLASNIIHAMSLRDMVRLFRRVHRSMEPGGLFIVKDFHLDPSRTSPLGSAMFAVNMLVSTDEGNCYTAAQIGGALREAGFVRIARRRFAGLSALYLARKRKRLQRGSDARR